MEQNLMLPFQLEPEFTDEAFQLRKEANRPVDVKQNAVDSDDDYENQNPQRLGNTLWRQCDNCASMPTVKECLSCLFCNEESASLVEKLHEGFYECVVQHEYFKAICLTEAVLEILMHCLRDVRGYGAQLRRDTSTYRLVAYHAYIFRVHHRLGRNNCTVIPSCVVTIIRETFPSPDGIYKGYEDVDDAWDL